MLLPPEFGELLAELNRDNLDYVVVGGVAVNLLGFERMTNDVDVLVPARRDHAQAIRRCLDRLGATRIDGSPLPAGLFDGEHHVRARTNLGIIDFIPEGEGVLAYACVARDAQPAELHGVVVPRASAAHMAALKRLADRPKDRQDLAMLEAAYGPLPDPDA